jgi:hypothetical protein
MQDRTRIKNKRSTVAVARSARPRPHRRPAGRCRRGRQGGHGTKGRHPVTHRYSTLDQSLCFLDQPSEAIPVIRKRLGHELRRTFEQYEPFVCLTRVRRRSECDDPTRRSAAGHKGCPCSHAGACATQCRSTGPRVLRNSSTGCEYWNFDNSNTSSYWQSGTLRPGYPAMQHRSGSAVGVQPFPAGYFATLLATSL